MIDYGLTWNELPVMPVDDDFIEHLREQGFETIEIGELFIEWVDWAKENVGE